MAIQDYTMVYVVMIRQHTSGYYIDDRPERAFRNYFDAQNYAQSNGGYVVSLGVT